MASNGFVEWVRTNKGYINTGYTINSNTNVIFNFMADSTLGSVSNDGYCGLFGTRSSASASNSFVLWRFGSELYRADVNTTKKQISASILGTHTVEMAAKASTNLIVDGTSYSIGNSSAPASNTYPLFIANMNTGGTDEGSRYGNRYCDITIYSFKIYEGDTLKMDFEPYLQDGVYGLYDTVGKQFYPSANSYAFTGGELLNQLDTYVNVDGVWKEVTNAYANVGGTWKEISEIGKKVGEIWQQ